MLSAARNWAGRALGPARRWAIGRPKVLATVRLGRRTLREVGDDRLVRLAAEVAFWALLSLPPLALGLLGLVGYVGSSLGASTLARIHHDVLHAAGTVLSPTTVHNVVRPLVDQVLAKGHPDAVSSGFFISFWSGSAAMNAYVDAITVAYDMGGLRRPWRTRLLALGLYLVAIAAGVILLPALALGPDVIVSLAPKGLTPQASAAVHGLYWPVVGLAALAVLTTLYWVAVPVRHPWYRQLPGAAVAMAVWLAGSFGLRFYLTSGLRNTSAAGSLSAPIAILLFFYVTALAVLLGAELNSTMDEMWPHPATAEGRRRAAALACRAG